MCGLFLLAPVASGSERPGEARPPTSIAPPDSLHLGVVWTPPTQTDAALRELNRIHALGATAVRLTRPPTDTVATQADTLDLRLYVDLPVTSVPAGQLQEALSRAAPTLRRVRALAQRHRSITHVGLARTADTTVPVACKVIRRWTNRVHSRSSLRTYYVTPFPASADRCADAVDRPLLDTRPATAPSTRWEHWHRRADRAGIGALGTWVWPDAPSGLRVPHSPEWQARFLEQSLSRVLDSTRSRSPVLFVSRWRDRPSSPLPSRHYGLHEADGSARPAADVVRGFYTGTQRTFAFPPGTAPTTVPYGLLVLGWGLVALLGGLYAWSLFVRRTLVRYFTAHGFYRDALREGRDLKGGANGLLLGTVTLALGATGTIAARLAASHPATELVLGALPPGLTALVAGSVEHPITGGVGVGGLALGLILLWMTALVLVARRWTRFSLSQGLTLVVWPCWPALTALPIALATASRSPLPPSLFALFLLVGSGLGLVYYTGRVLLDYQAVTNLPWAVVLLLGGLSPLALVGISGTALVLRYDVSLPFLWRLATLPS